MNNSLLETKHSIEKLIHKINRATGEDNHGLSSSVVSLIQKYEECRSNLLPQEGLLKVILVADGYNQITYIEEGCKLPAPITDKAYIWTNEEGETIKFPYVVTQSITLTGKSKTK